MLTRVLVVAALVAGGCDRLLPFGPGADDRPGGVPAHDGARLDRSPARLEQRVPDGHRPEEARRPEAGADVVATCKDGYNGSGLSSFAFSPPSLKPGYGRLVFVATRVSAAPTFKVTQGSTPLDLKGGGIGLDGAGLSIWFLPSGTTVSSTELTIGTVPPTNAMLAVGVCAIDLKGYVAWMSSKAGPAPGPSTLSLSVEACPLVVDMAFVVGATKLTPDGSQTPLGALPPMPGATPAITTGTSWRSNVTAGDSMSWTQVGTYPWLLAAACVLP